MRTLLWLDDYRNPYINEEGRVPKGAWNIVWVTSYKEFVKYILQEGMPHAISFDHDLADEHYTPPKYWNDYEASKAYQEAQTYKEKTGYDCAKWLVDYCMDSGTMLPQYFVHSANPVGADNIHHYLSNYQASTLFNPKIVDRILILDVKWQIGGFMGEICLDSPFVDKRSGYVIYDGHKVNVKVWGEGRPHASHPDAYWETFKAEENLSLVSLVGAYFFLHKPFRIVYRNE
jgi:hypothetical protein